jgi:hypothetical protein
MMHPTLMLRIAAEQHRDAIARAAQARRAGQARRFRHTGTLPGAPGRQPQLRSELAAGPDDRQRQPIAGQAGAQPSGPSRELATAGQSDRCADLGGHVR